jgi:hypothetical protein
MADFWACTLAEIKALGAWCMIHGPEIWLGLVAWCVLSIAVVIGMWLGTLLSANREKDDESKRNL